MAKKMDWDKAKEHLDTFKELYRELGPVGTFGLMHILELERRYESGERTKYLYDDILSVE